MSRRKVLDKKIGFAAALTKSLIRNLRIQASLKEKSPSQYVEGILREAIPQTYNFVKDDKLFGLPKINGTKKEVLKIWVGQLEREGLTFSSETLSYKSRSLKVKGLEGVMNDELELSLKETLYNFFYPEGIEKEGQLSEDEVRRVTKDCGIEGFFDVITEPNKGTLFIVPDRTCSLKKVLEVDKKLSSEKLVELIKENLKNEEV